MAESNSTTEYAYALSDIDRMENYDAIFSNIKIIMVYCFIISLSLTITGVILEKIPLNKLSQALNIKMNTSFDFQMHKKEIDARKPSFDQYLLDIYNEVNTNSIIFLVGFSVLMISSIILGLILYKEYNTPYADVLEEPYMWTNRMRGVMGDWWYNPRRQDRNELTRFAQEVPYGLRSENRYRSNQRSNGMNVDGQKNQYGGMMRMMKSMKKKI